MPVTENTAACAITVAMVTAGTCSAPEIFPAMIVGKTDAARTAAPRHRKYPGYDRRSGGGSGPGPGPQRGGATSGAIKNLIMTVPSYVSSVRHLSAVFDCLRL
jgi:hypothetical protein